MPSAQSVPAGSVRCLEIRQRLGGDVGCGSAHGSLDQFDEGEAADAEVIVLARRYGRRPAPRRIGRVRCTGRPTCSRIDRSPVPRLASSRSPPPHSKWSSRTGLVAAPRDEPARGVRQRRVTGRRGDRVGLLDQGGGSGELSGGDVNAGATGERDRKVSERSRVACEANGAGRELLRQRRRPTVRRRESMPTRTIACCQRHRSRRR